MRYNRTVEQILSEEGATFYVSPDRYVNCNWNTGDENTIETFYLGEEWDPEHGYGYVWSSKTEDAAEKMQKVEDWTCTPSTMCYVNGEYY